MLCNIGCNSEATALAALVGDEIAFRRDYARIDQANAKEVGRLIRTHLRKANAEIGIFAGLINILRGMRGSKRDLVEILRGQNEVAQKLGERLGLDSEICRALGQSHARWDGQGLPDGLAGSSIASAARAVRVAQDMLIFKQAFGRGQAIALLRERSGKVYEPKLVAELEDRASGLLAGLDELNTFDTLEALPGHDEWLTESEIEEALFAMADFIDIKSPFNMGHSRALAVLVELSGKAANLPADLVKTMRQATLLHDIGQSSVSARIFDKPGIFNWADREATKLHTYHGERILEVSPAFTKLGALVGRHHERLDGTGYHRGAAASALSADVRVLAAAEAYQGRTEARAHRKALLQQDARQALQGEAKAGKLDPRAVQAVLTAASQRMSYRPQARDRLTPREVDILRAMADGLSRRQTARKLGISTTVLDENQQSIFGKLKVRSRGAAILYAVEQGLAGQPSVWRPTK